MMAIDPTTLRFTYAAEQVLGRDVMAMKREDWTSMIRSDGMPTLMNEPPKSYEGVMKDAMVVAVAASGVCNPDPGFDIVRYDPDDAPHIYNVDHYRVCERLDGLSEFPEICRKAGVQTSPQLTSCVSDYVFVVRNEPSETTDHWSTDLPHRIQIAKHKEREAE